MVVKSVQTGKKASKVKRCFAAVVPANIKLVYLKRSLLQELAKAPECFQEKVVGSFVRIKSELSARLRKNSHQLEKVIGIISLDSEIHLRLSNCTRDVPLHLLSNGNFTEEECDDVHERVKAGTFKRLTIVDLEAKAKILHEDITKHSISWELSMLQPLIDQANEKGWREKKEAYLVKKQELQKPDEVETRLSQTPKVIAGAMESESSVNGPETVEVDIVDSNCNNGQESTKEACLGGKQEQKQEKEDVEVDSEALSEKEEDSELSYWINVHGFDLDTPKWHYFDPQGDIQGPFSLRPLKIWYCKYYFEDDAIIWKTGQNPDEDGLRMCDVICSAFRIE